MRFYEPDKGRILINGTDIRRIPKRKLRRMMTTVLQNASVVDGTVAENIAYGNGNVTGGQIEKAARLTHADRFIDRLENGYDTDISGELGHLSQGQLQLLCLSRASISSPKILILDEALSSVDAATETDIRESVLGLMKDQTCIVIAHRLSTVRDCDAIAVIDRGKVAEYGAHGELIAKRGLYYSLYETNLIPG